AEHRLGLLRRAAGHDIEAPGDQGLSKNGQYARFVIDQQHAAGDTGPRRAPDDLWLHVVGSGGMWRQQHAEDRPDTSLRLDQHMSMVLVHDPMNHRKSHAAALARLFRRVERVEYPLDCAGVDPVALVGDAKLDEGALDWMLATRTSRVA